MVLMVLRVPLVLSSVGSRVGVGGSFSRLIDTAAADKMEITQGDCHGLFKLVDEIFLNLCGKDPQRRSSLEASNGQGGGLVSMGDLAVSLLEDGGEWSSHTPLVYWLLQNDARNLHQFVERNKPNPNPNPNSNPRNLHQFDERNKCGLYRNEMGRALCAFLSGGSFQNEREDERDSDVSVEEKNLAVLVESLSRMLGVGHECDLMDSEIENYASGEWDTVPTLSEMHELPEYGTGPCYRSTQIEILSSLQGTRLARDPNSLQRCHPGHARDGHDSNPWRGTSPSDSRLRRSRAPKTVSLLANFAKSTEAQDMRCLLRARDNHAMERMEAVKVELPASPNLSKPFVFLGETQDERRHLRETQRSRSVMNFDLERGRREREALMGNNRGQHWPPPVRQNVMPRLPGWPGVGKPLARVVDWRNGKMPFAGGGCRLMSVPVLKPSNTHLLEGVILHRQHGGQASKKPGEEGNAYDHIQYMKIRSPARPQTVFA